MDSGAAIESIILIVIFCVVFATPVWRICRRAGFNHAISLIAFIPFIGFLLIAGLLAFSEWPVQPSKAES